MTPAANHPNVLLAMGSVMEFNSLPRRVRNAIVKAATNHEVSVAEIMGRSRLRHVATARFAAMRAIRELSYPPGVPERSTPFYSFPRIAKIFDRDHTTVVYAIRGCAPKPKSSKRAKAEGWVWPSGHSEHSVSNRLTRRTA